MTSRTLGRNGAFGGMLGHRYGSYPVASDRNSPRGCPTPAAAGANGHVPLKCVFADGTFWDIGGIGHSGGLGGCVFADRTFSDIFGHRPIRLPRPRLHLSKSTHRSAPRSLYTLSAKVGGKVLNLAENLTSLNRSGREVRRQREGRTIREHRRRSISDAPCPSPGEHGGEGARSSRPRRAVAPMHEP